MGQAGTVVIPYAPRVLQQEIHDNLQRFSVLVCHRRFGKTVLCINQLLKDACTNTLRAPRYAYMAPLRNQAKTIAWDYLRHYAGVIPGTSFNEAELRCDLPNKARITLYGCDNPDALRGAYYDGVVLDEYGQMNHRVWGEVVRPTLADRKGYAIIIGTPMGKNQFWDMYRLALESGWYTKIYKASETNVLPEEELVAAKQQMSEEQYEQEFECSFTAAITGAYYGKTIEHLEKGGKVTAVPHDPQMVVHTGWDLGIGDSTAIWFAQLTPGGEVRLIDFYENSGEGLAHYVNILKKKPYNYGKHYAPHDIEVRELGTGKSRKDIGKKLGIKFTTVPRWKLEDGIEAARVTLPMCWFDEEKTNRGLEALKQYRKEWNPKLNTYRDHPLHDWTSHAADAFRYFCIGFRRRQRDRFRMTMPPYFGEA